MASIDGIDRLRFTTSHPIEFTDDIIDVYRDTPELVDFVHLPVQAGSDRILTMMKRGHTALEYKSVSYTHLEKGLISQSIRLRLKHLRELIDCP